MAATSQAKRRSSVWVWVVSAAVVVAVFYFARMLTRPKLPVRVDYARMGSLTTTEATNGKVEPVNNYEAHAPFPGVVKAIYVHEGDKVPQGKLLLAMDDTDARARVAAALAGLSGAQAGYQAAQRGGTPEQRVTLQGDLQRAEIERNQAQADLNALKKLEASGAASPSEVAAAQQRLAVDNSSIQTLQQQQTSRYNSDDKAHALANLENAQAEYAAAEAALKDAVVHAPFSGTVYSIPVSRTEYVQQGERLLSMANLDNLQVEAYFDEPAIGPLQVGQPVTIVWDARPSQIFHGVIARVPATIVTYLQTRNVGVVLVKLQDDHDDLLPDTSVRVTVTIASESNVLIVPRDALHIEGGNSYVYRVEGNTLHRTPVTIGKLNLVSVQIVSGLKAGDEIALGTTNAQPLSDGEPVEVVQ